MAKVIILNASPRAARSNSKKYAALFEKYSKGDCIYTEITKNNHDKIIAELQGCEDMVFIFPLYADSLPVGLVNFLKTLESNSLKSHPTVSVLVNCGFIEYSQNDVAVLQMALFCKQNDYPFGSVLKIGSGEAILDTPFSLLVKRQIKKFARSVKSRRYSVLRVTMPLSKKTYIKASVKFWIKKAAAYGTEENEMRTMLIEDGLADKELK